jgi:hypothetical protein
MIGTMFSPVGVAGCHGERVLANYILSERPLYSPVEEALNRYYPDGAPRIGLHAGEARHSDQRVPPGGVRGDVGIGYLEEKRGKNALFVGNCAQTPISA